MMKISKFLEFLVSKARILRWIMYGVLVSLVVLDLLTPPKYQRFPWDDIGGFGAVYGFVSCVLIIIVSKALGYAMLYRSEDYYED